jgi:hypothetical protein
MRSVTIGPKGWLTGGLGPGSMGHGCTAKTSPASLEAAFDQHPDKVQPILTSRMFSFGAFRPGQLEVCIKVSSTPRWASA